MDYLSRRNPLTLDLNLGDAFSSPSGASTFLERSQQVWHKVSDTGQLLKAVDTLAPLDKPATLKVANTRIANVYTTLSKGAIPLSAQAHNTTGQAVFVELNAVASRGSGATEVLLPVLCRFEFRLPNDLDVTESLVLSTLIAALSGVTDRSGNFKVTQIMRGILFHDDET
jgi:hypothetical protein